MPVRDRKYDYQHFNLCALRWHLQGRLNTKGIFVLLVAAIGCKRNGQYVAQKHFFLTWGYCKTAQTGADVRPV